MVVLSDDQECDALARLKYKRNRVPQGAQGAEVTRRAFNAPPSQARHGGPPTCLRHYERHLESKYSVRIRHSPTSTSPKCPDSSRPFAFRDGYLESNDAIDIVRLSRSHILGTSFLPTAEHRILQPESRWQARIIQKPRSQASDLLFHTAKESRNPEVKGKGHVQ